MATSRQLPTSGVTIIDSGTNGDSQSAMSVAPWIKEMSPHQHTPLDLNTKSIRLLEVHPGLGYDSLSCTLSQHDLDDSPSYTALSYTWDQSGARRTIMCDGMTLDIGENLWRFFCEYRRKQVLDQYAEEPCTALRHLWIDAICIDQSNLKERNQQVSQMRDIYTNAEAVIVWLGLDQGHEELAFTLTRYPDLLEVEMFQTGLLDLLKKPYFSRVWVRTS
jgi:hypothetical protein